MLCDVTSPEPSEKQGRMIYFSNEISFMVGSRANAISRERMESSLFDEVLSVGGDGFILCYLGLQGSRDFM